MNSSRRLFLKGAATSLALPFFPSLAPRTARADVLSSGPRRFLAFYVPNGIHMPKWTPQVTGADWESTPILAPLADLRGSLLPITGLANVPAYPEGGAGAHASGTAGFLSCRKIRKTTGVGVRNGISVDQVAARSLTPGAVPFSSLQVGTEGGGPSGDCDSGFSCVYARNISWASETLPLAKMVEPAALFDLLFGGSDRSATQIESARRRRYQLSILDAVTDQTRTLVRRMGAADRVKLDEYLSGLRELELRIEAAPHVCEAGARSEGELSYPDQVKALLDLLVVAMRCDLTRVATFMLGNAASNRAYPFIGVPNSHHEISHHSGNPIKLAGLQAINTWEVEQLGYLLRQMKAIDEGGTSLLDNSIVYFSSEIEDGDSHSHHNMPVLVAGTAGGRLQAGQHLKYEGSPPLANLFTTLLRAFGAPIDAFGDDGTGVLPGMVVA